MAAWSFSRLAVWPPGRQPGGTETLCLSWTHQAISATSIKTVLLPNGGFCNGCITKRILLLQVFHSHENQYYADYNKK
jgi:hypothetical protein